jgi:hypothetical protein
MLFVPKTLAFFDFRNGRHRIRTCDFYRVRKAPDQAEKPKNPGFSVVFVFIPPFASACKGSSWLAKNPGITAVF